MTTTASMDAETLEALRGSIAKWRAIVDGTGKDEGPNNCPLCQKFNRMCNPDAEPWCGGCPVTSIAAMPNCSGTPYDDYSDAEDEGDAEAMKAAAQAELDFLVSLLPEGAT